MSEENMDEEVGIDLDEIARKYDEQGFFSRLGDMYNGLGKPHDTREYKLARIELQRLAAPLVAIVVPVAFGVVLCVVTMMSGQKKVKIEVNIAQEGNESEELKEEEKVPLDDIEPLPMEEVEITVDTPNPDPHLDSDSYANAAIHAGIRKARHDGLGRDDTGRFFDDKDTNLWFDSGGLAGVGTLAMQLLGRGNEPEASNALEVMRDWKPTFDPDGISEKNLGGCPQYYCYYATQCKYQAGMKADPLQQDKITWEKWNAEMRELYPSLIKETDDKGNPLPKVLDHTGEKHTQGYFENNDRWTTRPYMDPCLVALQLMVYYRYLPTTTVEAGKDDAGADGDAAQAMDISEDVVVTVDI